MERLAELLFELSNQDRLQILIELENENAKLTQISKKLDLTAQEASRHLSRLSKTGLLQKLADGAYSPTEYCRQVLHLIPGFVFLSDNRDYFISHTMKDLHTSFINRVGELSKSIRTDNAIVLFQMVDTLVSEANEYVWIQSDQALSSTLPLLMNALERGVTFRTILPSDMGTPQIPREHIPDFSQYRQTVMENKHLDQIDVVVILSEKEAVVAFATKDRKMDYLGFYIRDCEGHQWCFDLFEHYWKQGISV